MADDGPAQDHADSTRAEVRQWLAEHWRADVPRADWLALVVDSGYAVPSWPREWYGRGVTHDEALAVVEEFRHVGAPGSGQDLYNIFAATMLSYGSASAKQQFIRPLLLGDIATCLLYSEPGAGSDLAAVQTRADRDGDEWVVTGQKVWTSGGHLADYGLLLARTDWDVPKHRGISFFWFPMRQPGVEVRPIRQITGESHFNEVFIDNARVPDDHLLGDREDGWRILQTALAYERSIMADMARGPRSLAADSDGEEFGALDATMSGEVDLAALARSVGRESDPLVRDAIARIHILRSVNRWNTVRAKEQLAQGLPSPIMSLGKLAMSRILHEGAHIQCEILGAEAMLTGPEHPDGDAAGFMSLNAFFTSIGGGTDQIQRNIIAERVLGLPKEPEVDRDLAFRDVPKATITRR